jgi:hypothetical protein
MNKKLRNLIYILDEKINNRKPYGRIYLSPADAKNLSEAVKKLGKDYSDIYTALIQEMNFNKKQNEKRTEKAL